MPWEVTEFRIDRSLGRSKVFQLEALIHLGDGRNLRLVTDGIINSKAEVHLNKLPVLEQAAHTAGINPELLASGIRSWIASQPLEQAAEA